MTNLAIAPTNLPPANRASWIAVNLAINPGSPWTPSRGIDNA